MWVGGGGGEGVFMRQYESWSSDLALFLENRLMHEHHIL